MEYRAEPQLHISRENTYGHVWVAYLLSRCEVFAVDQYFLIPCIGLTEEEKKEMTQVYHSLGPCVINTMLQHKCLFEHLYNLLPPMNNFSKRVQLAYN